ncbi:hypothetical protein [uncultured Acetatifactor sp.]|nr:hypothetical protein [uncultured Acetatifactor sp.]
MKLTVEATAFDRMGVVDTEMLNRCFTEIRLAMHGKEALHVI